MKFRRRGDRVILERPEYYVQTGSMFENPYGVPPGEIVRMILENPAEVTAQTVFGKYVESSGLVFTADLIQMLFDRTAKHYFDRHFFETGVQRDESWRPIIGNTWVFKPALGYAEDEQHRNGGLRHSTRFFTGIDFARLQDYTVIFTIDTNSLPARVVYYRRLNRVNWDAIYAEVGRVAKLFGPNILADSTGMGGDVVLDALHSRLYCPMHHAAVLADSRCLHENGAPKECKRQDYISLACVEGYDFSPVGQSSRKKMLVDHLRHVLAVGYSQAGPGGEFGWLRCPPIPQLEEELSFYAWNDKGLETDCLFALALAAWHGLEDPVRAVSIGGTFGH